MSTYTRLNVIFKNMKLRCYNPKSKDYKRYGGRGIKICKEWNDREIVIISGVRYTKGYLAFKKWALENGYQDNLTIDRIDVNGNYEPSNCRWATKKEQCNNTRRNRYITYKGKTQSFAKWQEELNIPRTTFYRKIKNGWTAERIFNERQTEKQAQF